MFPLNVVPVARSPCPCTWPPPASSSGWPPRRRDDASWFDLEVVPVVPDVREERLLHLGHEETVLARAAVTEKGKIWSIFLYFAPSGR